MSELYEKTVKRIEDNVMPTYAPKQLFVRGEGCRLWDSDGVEYLDFTSGIAVCNLGHCHPGVTAAITSQARTLVHVSNIYMNSLAPALAEKLVSESGMEAKIFFCNSGAEANEGLIKIARKYGNQTGRNEIISMENSFHGRTLATLAATGRKKYRQGFEPDVPGFKQVPFNDFEALKNAVTDKTCAIMLEMVQGEGGVIPADVEYLKQVRALCDEKDLLMLCDEVQCGMGRLGSRFAFQSFGVVPDAVSMAKGIANGAPMGAFMAKNKYADLLTVGTHGTTFGGTALAAAAALAVQEAFDKEGVLENCAAMGSYMMEQLAAIGKKYSFVQGVRGRGLMIGLALDCEAGPVQKLIQKRNLLVLTAGESVVRFVPPLIVTNAEIDRALAIVDEALAEFDKER
ncbi:MAG: aspartate aminotransferase family protein [Lentisphaeria bacterium]|nr:aspartate aminotransferase family protein [Lentisphaeria bacterium]